MVAAGALSPSQSRGKLHPTFRHTARSIVLTGALLFDFQIFWKSISNACFAILTLTFDISSFY